MKYIFYFFFIADLANKSILGCFVNQVGIRRSLNIFARLPAESQKDETNAYRPWNYDFKLISDMIFRSLYPFDYRRIQISYTLY